MLEPSQRAWIDDGWVTVNSLGFRGMAPTVPKPIGRTRVVFIGDSVTFGRGVNDDETFPSQLERLVRNQLPTLDFDVVNLGVEGYDTRQEVTLLKRYLSRLNPDLVLLGFYSNDVADAASDDWPTAAAGTPIKSASPAPGRLLHMNPSSASWLERQLRKTRTGYLLGRAINRLRGTGEWSMARFSMELDLLNGTQSGAIERAWERVDVQFGELRATGIASAFAAGIVVLPCREQVMGEFPSARYQDRVRALAEERGLFVIDLLPSMARARRQELFIPYDRNHPSPAGHRLIAQAVLQYLEAHGTIPAVR